MVFFFSKHCYQSELVRQQLTSHQEKITKWNTADNVRRWIFASESWIQITTQNFQMLNGSNFQLNPFYDISLPQHKNNSHLTIFSR